MITPYLCLILATSFLARFVKPIRVGRDFSLEGGLTLENCSTSLCPELQLNNVSAFVIVFSRPTLLTRGRVQQQLLTLRRSHMNLSLFTRSPNIESHRTLERSQRRSTDIRVHQRPNFSNVSRRPLLGISALRESSERSSERNRGNYIVDSPWYSGSLYGCLSYREG